MASVDPANAYYTVPVLCMDRKHLLTKWPLISSNSDNIFQNKNLCFELSRRKAIKLWVILMTHF